MKFVHVSILFLLALCSVAMAQTNTATLRGTVTDATQAVLPAVSVSAINTATGLTRTVTSDQAGNYELSFLPPGAYRLDAERNGFKTYTQEGITLAAGEIKRLDVPMTIGGANEAVTVTANVTTVNSETGELSTGIAPKQIEALPLLGRNFNTLIALQPGVRSNRAASGLSFNINGGPAGNGFNITLDGTDATAVSTQRVAVSRSGFQQTNTTRVEAMQEIRVYTNLYSAEIGRSTSGAVNVITKSGSNDWHFGAFEFLRNDKLNANSATANAARLGRAPTRFNQFGANGSGPIIGNKTFFWAGYEGVRSGRGRTANYTVLTDAGPPRSGIPPCARMWTNGFRVRIKRRWRRIRIWLYWFATKPLPRAKTSSRRAWITVSARRIRCSCATTWWTQPSLSRACSRRNPSRKT